MTLRAPLKWKVKDGTNEIWVDCEEGLGTLLGRLEFDPDWGDEAKRVNLQAIVDSVNGHKALLDAVVLFLKGIRNKSMKDQ